MTIAHDDPDDPDNHDSPDEEDEEETNQIWFVLQNFHLCSYCSI